MTLLNTANQMRLGSNVVAAVYAGATKVWTPFLPNQMTGCKVWLDASRIYPVPAHGGPVSLWANIVGGSPTLAGTPAPVFLTNQLNTVMPCVRVTRGQGRYRFASTGTDKDWTLIYVGRKWQMTPGRVITAMGSVSNILIGYHMSEWDQCYVEGWLTPTTTTQATAWKLYSADSTSTAPARFFSDGVLLYSGAATPSLGWGNTLNISGFNNDADASTSQQADCDIAELVLFNRKLTDPERQTVEKYLREKWSVPTKFKPSDLGSSLLGWFDGSDASTVTRTGTGVSNWVNKGVSTLAITQATDMNKPSYNGSDTVNITTPQKLDAVNCPATYDLALVGRPQHLNRGEWRTLLRGITGSHQIIIESGALRMGTYNGGFFPATGLTWENVWGVGYGKFSSAAAVELSRDGGAMASTGTIIAAADVPFVAFGGYQGGSQGWGDIKEIIFLPYNSEGLRPMVEGYLAHRHGLAGLLPAGHRYKSAPP